MKKQLIILLSIFTIIFSGCANHSMDETSKTAPSESSDLYSDLPDGNEEPAELLSKAATTNKNPYFFQENIQTADYDTKFTFWDDDSLPAEMELSINELLHFDNGTLYELKLNYDETFNGRDYYGWDRFHLGYFYVQEDKIYLIREAGVIEHIQTEADILSQGTIVCQQEELKDTLEEEEKGLHEFITLNDNQCEYHSYNNLTETGFYETFVWEKGKGLVRYKSGFGAERDDIELQMHDYETNGLSSDLNLLEYMQDGLEEPSLVNFYQQDINDVNKLTNGSIIIRYYTADLNEDGLDDKIVSVISPLHSGSHGDSFDILINNGNSYSDLSYLTIPLWHQDSEFTPAGSVYILEDTTNGFHDIRITFGEYNLILQCEDGIYQIKE